MLNKIFFIFIFAFGFVNTLAQENKLNFPAPIGFVNDFADVLTVEQELKLESLLENSARNAPLEISVVTVKTTGENNIDDYSLAMARRWKIGSKTKTSYGVLLLIDVGSRKYRTQISRDLETVFSDSQISEMQKQTLVPAFRKNDFFQGISDYLSIFYEDFAEIRKSRVKKPDAIFNRKTSQSLVNDSLQSIVVTTRDWNALRGSAQIFERADTKAEWKTVGESFPVVVGKNGLGWSDDARMKAETEPRKVEGDGRAPAGIFRLISAFGSSAKPDFVKFPFTRLTETIECVDDSESKQYNLIVDNKNVSVDWASSEKMLAVGEQYDLGVFVAHNSNPAAAKKGSCIFLHIWKTDATGTAGCTAMKREDIENVLSRLDPRKNPILIQMPARNYRQFQTLWKLPKFK